MIRQLAYLAAVVVGGVAYVIADCLDPDYMARMDRHLNAYQKALEARHPCVAEPEPWSEDWAYEASDEDD